MDFRHWLWACGTLIVLLLGGCLPSAKKEEAAAASYASVLPLGWEAISDWQDINLDGDKEDENLLLYSFESGQVGALITEGDPAASSEAEYIFPRFFDDYGALGQGIIAAPGTLASDIAVTQVKGNSPPREATILGDGSHLTFVWWRGGESAEESGGESEAGNGYGVTQLYAPGGFGVDWETWQDDPKPIASVVGYYPLQDYRARSNICDMVLYTRRTDLPSDFPTIIFSGTPQGLHFCDSIIPPYPYAPEGVVLAYLRLPRTGDMGVEDLMTPGTTVAQVDAESAYDRLAIERIADIAAFPTLPMDRQLGSEAPPTTSVCVELAEISNRTLRRWIIYTLLYHPANSALGSPDRWSISGARTQPPPLQAPPLGYCTIILSRNAP